MARSCPHQPPVPSPAERARTTVVRATGAALIAGPLEDPGGRRPGHSGAAPRACFRRRDAAAARGPPAGGPHPCPRVPAAMLSSPTRRRCRCVSRCGAWCGSRRVLPARVAPRRAADRGRPPTSGSSTSGTRTCCCGWTRARSCSPTPRAPDVHPGRGGRRGTRPVRDLRGLWLAHLAPRTARCSPGSPATCRPPTAPGASLVPRPVDRLGLRLRVETDRGACPDARRRGARLAAQPCGVGGGSASRSGAVTFRSATNETNGMVPASATSSRRTDRPPALHAQVGRERQVAHVQEAVDRPDDRDEQRLVGEVLQRHRDQDEHEQSDADHPGHHPVALHRGDDLRGQRRRRGRCGHAGLLGLSGSRRRRSRRHGRARRAWRCSRCGRGPAAGRPARRRGVPRRAGA